MFQPRTREEPHHELDRTIRRLLESETPAAELKPRLLEAICVGEEWPFGTFWERDDAANVLRCAAVWHRPDDASLAELATMTAALTFAKGLGAPGRVWLTGEPQLIDNVRDEASFARRVIALRAGLHSAVVFPLLHDGEVLGVIDLIGRVSSDRMADELFGPLGRQIGEFLARSRISLH
jgi:hypothetical protein